MSTSFVKDLTKGSPWRLMISFATPIFLSQVFQQLYNTADSLIVGRFLGTAALAAVTSANNMVYLLINFFTGLSLGAGVVISKYFGAGEDSAVRKSLHTSTVFGFLSGLALSIAGVTLTPFLLSLMRVDAQVRPLAVKYYRLYFAGSLAVVMYNLCLGAMNALGDSKRPLVYLIFSSLLNVFLDWFFVGKLHLGVWSASLATIISQMLSTILCLIHLFDRRFRFAMKLNDLKMDKDILLQMIRFGLPSGVTNCVIGLANVVVQSSINSFGMTATAAFGAHTKIEGFGFLPITSFTMAISTFVSQNLGAKEYERAKKGAGFGIVISVLTAELIGVVLFFFSDKLIAFFDSSPEVIDLGARSERIMALFYCLLAFSHAAASVFRGAGMPVIPMVVMLSDWCFFRISYITFVMKKFGEIELVFWAYPITWFISSVIFLIIYFCSDWVHGFEKKKITQH